LVLSKRRAALVHGTDLACWNANRPRDAVIPGKELSGDERRLGHSVRIEDRDTQHRLDVVHLVHRDRTSTGVDQSQWSRQCTVILGKGPQDRRCGREVGRTIVLQPAWQRAQVWPWHAE